MKKLAYDNVNRFIGICLDYQRTSAARTSLPSTNKLAVSVFEYQQKGTLRTMLQNADFNIEKDLMLSFMADCVRGLRALHDYGGSESSGLVHGFLHTGDVMLDGKLTCKITDYGLGNWGRSRGDLIAANVELIIDDEEEEYGSNCRLLKLVFRPPEQLRDGYENCSDLKRSDVFSVGVVMAEIYTREVPVFVEQKPASSEASTTRQPQAAPSILFLPSQIINRQMVVADGILRPITPHIDSTCPSQLRELIADSCDGVRPEQRPKIGMVYETLSHLPGYVESVSIIERFAARLQRYADDLEALVAQRTSAVVEASQRSEQLLLQLLPGPVAAELKAGRHVEPEAFDCVSIYFSDIVGFTALSSRLSPLQVIDVLNAVYTMFDTIVEKYRVYKVETVGDAYMVVSGLPQRNGNKHAREICDFALAAVETLLVFSMPEVGHGLELPGGLKMRIGLHCGAVLAGVVGIKMPRYCLFGNTVNVAHRMESSGEALRIQASDSFYKFAEQHETGNYVWQKKDGGVSVVERADTKYWLLKRQEALNKRE